MTRHTIRWWTDAQMRVYCTVCRRRISHVAFTKRDGTLIDFDYHYGPVLRDAEGEWRG